MGVAKKVEQAVRATPRRGSGKSGVVKKTVEKKSLQKKPGNQRPKSSTWRTDFSIIQELRAVRDAPVDILGCERLADPGASQKDFEWQCLVAAMLSSQTKDQMIAEAMAALSAHGNTVERIAETAETKLDGLIAKVGFHSTKAKNLRAAARMCMEQHRGRVPQTLDGLMALPGVGPKMAHLTLHAAFGNQIGLCIDTHIHRITNALCWVETKSPEETRVALESWLPREYWQDFSVLLVGLGQMQQQRAETLVQRCLESSRPVPALKLVARIGLQLRSGKFPALDAAALTRPSIRGILLQLRLREGD